MTPMAPAADPVNGVFAQFELVTSSAAKKLREVKDWKVKLTQWIRDEQITGETIKTKANKDLQKTMRAVLEADDKKAKKFNGPCGKLLTICKKMPVHQVLQAAAKAANGGADAPQDAAKDVAKDAVDKPTDDVKGDEVADQ